MSLAEGCGDLQKCLYFRGLYQKSVLSKATDPKVKNQPPNRLFSPFINCIQALYQRQVTLFCRNDFLPLCTFSKPLVFFSLSLWTTLLHIKGTKSVYSTEEVIMPFASRHCRIFQILFYSLWKHRLTSYLLLIISGHWANASAELSAMIVSVPAINSNCFFQSMLPQI